MARAIAKYVRMSPRKLRRVINVIRGKDAQNARITLKFMPYAAARVIEKVLISAISNAKQNDKLNPDELRITKAFVDQSSTLRRWRAMSKGRGFPILKRTSHVTVEVNHDEKLIGREPVVQGKTLKYKKHKHDDHVHDHEQETKAKKEVAKRKEKDKKGSKKEE